MSATLLFVHGTGTREAVYTATLEQIKRAIAENGLDLDVKGCYWGEAEGARLRVDGHSIPNYADARKATPSDADRQMMLWTLLYTDAYYELRMLRHLPNPGDPYGVALIAEIDAYRPSPELQTQLAELGLAELFDSAFKRLRSSQEFEDAAGTAPPQPQDHRRAIARALVADTLIVAEETGLGVLDGRLRDALVDRLSDELKGFGLGFSDFLLRPVKGLALRAVTSRLTSGRAGLTDGTTPMAGDVLRFLAAGDGLRTFLRRAIEDVAAKGDVFVLGHSLGGIMAATSGTTTREFGLTCGAIRLCRAV